MLRLLLNLLRFGRSSSRRADSRKNLKDTYGTARAKADASSQDYFLQRDLAALKDDEQRKQK